VIVGTREQIADDIEHWFSAGAADGFNLMPYMLPDGLAGLRRRRGTAAAAARQLPH
jgi:alkanesulfonate monooxygenase SsuD/methylene tetrahydromethanopterin reductase-like flavin-dependent oxidoreductase (luciferase family)